MFIWIINQPSVAGIAKNDPLLVDHRLRANARGA
jgi:hypothetical protein